MHYHYTVVVTRQATPPTGAVIKTYRIKLYAEDEEQACEIVGAEHPDVKIHSIRRGAAIDDASLIRPSHEKGS